MYNGEDLEEHVEAFRKLATNCVNYSVHARDWPRFSGLHYEVRGTTFWVGARCVGRTLDEAVDRTLRLLKRRDSRIKRGKVSDFFR